MHYSTLLAMAAMAPAWAGAPPPPTVMSELQYQSTFADYHGWRDEPVKSWREANERILRSGGHMGHASGSAAAPEQPKKVPEAGGEPAPHAGHRHGDGR